MARNFQPLFSYKEQKMEQSNNVYKEYIPRVKACKLLRDLSGLLFRRYLTPRVASRSNLLPERGGGESVISQFLENNYRIFSSCSTIASSKTSQSVILYFFFYSSLFPAQNSLSKLPSRLSPLKWHKVAEWRCKFELNTYIHSAIQKQLTEVHGGSDLFNESRFKILMKC